MSHESPAEIYAFELNSNDPKHYAQVPGVLFHCTYIAQETRKDSPNFGKQVRKKLSPFAISLYTFVKQICGKTGKVWMNTENLAEACNMSVGSITNAKKELLQPMEQLNGKAPIEIKTSKRTFIRQDGTKGAKDYHVITPTHIWPENNAYMATFNYQPDMEMGIVEDVHNPGSDSRSELDEWSDSRSELDSLGSDSRREPIKNRTDNLCLFKTDKTAEPPVCFSNQSDQSVNSVIDTMKIAGIQDTGEAVKNVFRTLGADESFLTWLFKNYPLPKIIAAGQYYDSYRKKKAIPNPIGYIRMALTKGWVK